MPKQRKTGARTRPKRAPAKPQANTRFRDRIVELRRVPAAELLDNPANWRRHTDEQVAALTSILDRIGIVGAVLARETPEGLLIIDGHLRKGIVSDEIVPVLVTDLSEAEAAIVLATYDPIGELAQMDAQALKALLEQVDVDDEDAFMRKLFSDVHNDLAAEIETSGAKPKIVEGMALEPHEHYDYLVVCCQTSHEWNVLCDRLQLKPEKRRAKVGTARAIRATRLLEKLNAKA